MSLQTCPHCHQHHDRRTVYRFLNKPPSRSEKNFICPQCKQSYHPHMYKPRHYQKLKLLARAIIPVLIVIGFVYAFYPWRMAIIGIIVYHYLCFIGIIHYLSRKQIKK